jgi:hypothetical protein
LKKWGPGNSSTPDFFRDKAAVYNELLNLAPAGAGRDAVVRGELDFLQQSREQAGSRIEWFLPLNGLIGRTTLDPAGFGNAAALMQKSSDPVVSFYSRLEVAAPRPVDRIMSLL